MKLTILPAAIFAFAAFTAVHVYGVSTNAIVKLTSSGSGSKSYHDPSGWWQTIDYTCVVSLTINPRSPARINDVFESSQADITGSIRFIAHAEDHFFGSTTIHDYDVTRNYNAAQLAAYTDFLASDRSVWWVGSPLPYSAGDSPRIYGIKFDGETGVLTNLVQLPSFWYFDNNYPVYASAVSTNRPRLVLVSHGWNAGAVGWPTDMRNSIASQLSDRLQGSGIPVSKVLWNENDADLPHGNVLPTGWEVAVVDWPQRASALHPWKAQRNGAVLGRWLGTLIQQFNYESIHVIAHSAGSWLIDAVADTVKKLDQQEGRQTDIHITFLDAYAQGSTYSLLGDHGDWVEHYLSEEPVPGLPGTDWTLPWAFNMEITDLKPAAQASHGWPPAWYGATTINPLAPVFGGVEVGPYGWGFKESVEYAGHHPSFANHPMGERINLKTGAHVESKPKIQQRELDLPVDPRLLTVSDPAKVKDITGSGFTLTTGSPTWVSMPVVVAGGYDLIRFNYQFLSNSLGTLHASVDTETVFQAQEVFSSGLQNSDWLLLADEPRKTNFTVRFLVDTAGGVASTVRISNIQLGNLQVEPSLGVERVGGLIKLKWSRRFPQVSVQSAQLVDGAWSPVSDQPQLEGDWLFVTTPVASGARFYRLVSP